MAFSLDGTLLAVGKENGAFICDVQTGTNRREIESWQRADGPVAFSPDERFLLIGGHYGTVGVSDVTSGKLLVVLVNVDSGSDWLVFTPDGRYDGSEGGRKLISFRVLGNSKPVPGEQLAKDYYRPGLLRTILADKPAK